MKEIRLKQSDHKNLQSVHENKKPFNCTLCDLSFSIRGNLERHATSVHEGQKPFECSICYSRIYTRKEKLSEYIAVVHEGKEPFVCSTCDHEVC